jgi:non-reducing end alpha-L-arabinofuranosidase
VKLIPRKFLVVAIIGSLTVTGLLISGTAARSATVSSTAARVPQEACDILATHGTPCVEALSTTRALYGRYKGPLYRVRRSSDGKAINIYPVSAGGAASTARQRTFCRKTTCTITVIFDQSGHGNNLTPAPAGSAGKTADSPARAGAAPAKADGRTVYGVSVTPGVGYRDDRTRAIPTGNAPEGIYEVVAGNHFNSKCCFDFGNAETSNTDTGKGHMEALYYGTAGGGTRGSGPWIKADLENGLYFTGPTMAHRFTTAMLGGGAGAYSLRAGSADAGKLTVTYDGPRPTGYNPMHKEGAVILGIGGDNSKWGAGTFYEGVITRGVPTAAADAAVQANIVAAHYRS